MADRNDNQNAPLALYRCGSCGFNTRTRPITVGEKVILPECPFGHGQLKTKDSRKLEKTR